MKHAYAGLALLLAVTPWIPPVLAQQPAPSSPNCPVSSGTTDAAKSHTLFLYFPGADDPNFCAFKTGVSPVHAFDAASLNPALKGQTQALIERTRQVVADDYCEFNVQVKTATANPVPTTSSNPDPCDTSSFPSVPDQRVTVAIGADATGGGDWGKSDAVDIGDSSSVNFARVWAGYYSICEGGDSSGNPKKACLPPVTGLLTGANATVDRWAQAIGGSAAHEAGHGYGLAHTNDDPTTDPFEPGTAPLLGEDSFHRHLMPAGYNLTPTDRATYRRHFSDKSYGLLATNVGLSIQTMHNWDLQNPNQAAGYRLSIDFLSVEKTINLQWAYSGSENPWDKPTVTSLPAPPAFKGVYYNAYRITWSSSNMNYKDGTPGVIAGGGRFHIGATFIGVDFNKPDPIIIQDVTLYDANKNPLILHPRLPTYDTGTADGGGGFSLNMYTPPQGTPLRLQEARIYQLPRVASIDSMIGKGRPYTFDGLPIRPWSVTRCQPGSLVDGRHCVFAHAEDRPHVQAEYKLGEPGVIDCTRRVTLGKLRDRLPDGRLPEPQIPIRDGPKDSTSGPDAEGPTCAGSQRDPFPSTTVYMIATFVDPKARHYDPRRRRYVTGPVTSRVYYQFAGVRHLEGLWEHRQPDTDRRDR